MNVKGKINFFVNENKVGDNVFRNYSGSLSKKVEEGKYQNASIEIKFDSKKFTQDKLDKLELDTMYQMEVNEGFISFRTYETNGKTNYVLFIMVSDATILDSKKVENKKETNAPNKKGPF